jgi:amyloid beta (A4) precursor protein-binding family A protein 1 (X11)
MSSQCLDKAAEDMPEAEQDLERAPTPGGGRPDSPGLQPPAGQQRAAGPAGSGEAGQRYSKEKREAISLAIKDIKEAIEEVKTRTIRSPYTPDEPKEPIWVMRQDISPTRDCDDQRPMDGDVSMRGLAGPRCMLGGGERGGLWPCIGKQLYGYMVHGDAKTFPR